jgi:DNA-binding winged helix-turn-helix (wHTH) protein
MAASKLCFDGFELDPATGELSRDGATVRLEPQPAAVLAFLASRAGQLVTRDELRRVVWDENTHVNVEDGLNYAIRRVRLGLGDDPRMPQFIETIPKRGYRFLKPVRTAGGHDPGQRSPRSLFRTSLVGLAAAATLIGVLIMEWRPNRHHEITVRALEAVHDAVFTPSANPR